MDILENGEIMHCIAIDDTSQWKIENIHKI